MTKLIFRAVHGDVQEVVIPEGGLTIGRNQTCDLPIMEASVSGNHGSLRFERGLWWVHDNASSNGTFVNEVQVKDSVIANGDKLKFGDVEADFISVPESPESAIPVALAESGSDTATLRVSPEIPESPDPIIPIPFVAEDFEEVAPHKVPVVPAELVAEEKPCFELPRTSVLEAALKLPKETTEKEKEEHDPTEKRLASEQKSEFLTKKPKEGMELEIPSPDLEPSALQLDKNLPTEKLTKGDVALIADLAAKYKQIKEELAKVVIGHSAVAEEILIAVFSRGHALLVGVPGLAKTLLISTLSQVLELEFKRVQFTSDLVPSDLTGTDMFEEENVTGQRQVKFVKGPLFTNVLLADEINSTPPKTQTALLEAMQQHPVTVGFATYPLSEPFFVLATQNPIEEEGAYPLSEAQLDRFMLNIIVDYPTAVEESQIITRVTGWKKPKLRKILDGEKIIKIQELLRRVPMASYVINYARNLARATRPNKPEAPDFVNEMVGWGAGPRAGIYLIQAAKARAILDGRHYATIADVTAVALPVLRHRVITNSAAEAAGVKSDDVINMLISALELREELEI